MSLDFNHISKDLDKEVKKELVDLYKYYDLRFRGYRKWHKKLKKRKLYLHMTSIGFTTADGIVGGVTVNPIVIGTLAGIGGVIQGYIAKTELNKKVKRTRIAWSNYQGVCTQIRSFLRGMDYNSEIFLSDLKVVDDMVSDLCPPLPDSVLKGVQGVTKS
jgi:hypothetical protein